MCRSVIDDGRAVSTRRSLRDVQLFTFDSLDISFGTVHFEQVVAGTSSPLQSIDNNLAAMQGAMSLIDGLDAGGDATIAATKTQDKWFTGIGVAGPGVIAGSMLLLNKVALALFIGFGPLFILALLFPQTKSLFTKWLFYGIGTVFSLAVLSVMVSIASSMIGVVTAAFAAKYATLQALSALGLSNATASEGINSMAMQQGGLGLILSALIISAPPMAAAFFQGMLGQFQSFSSFGSIGAGQAAAAQQQRMLGNPAAAALPPAPNQAAPITEGHRMPAAIPSNQSLAGNAYTPQPDISKQKDFNS
jgi:type IV secretion system protein VirB6